MAMAASSLSSFGGQNVMLMRSDKGSSNSLVAMLTSCNPHVGFQVPRSGGGGLEDAIAGACGQKRAYYPTFDGTPLDGEPEDDVDGGDDLSHGGPVEKKRRLSFDQVRSLERNFEMENKLEPERKMQLAKELGLQPRQVAVWFQNRRARWKTKQLERDYEMLNSGYLKLKADFETALREKAVLKAEVQRLSGKTSSHQDAQSVDSSQCDSEAVTEPSPRKLAGSQTIDVCAATESSLEDVIVKEPQTTTSSGSNNNSTNSELVDAESPRTTDSSNQHLSAEDPQLAGYCNQFPTSAAADSFNVGPPGLHDVEVVDDAIVAALPVKLEDSHGFQVDPNCGYFLPPMVEQGVLPWWDWA